MPIWRKGRGPMFKGVGNRQRPGLALRDARLRRAPQGEGGESLREQRETQGAPRSRDSLYGRCLLQSAASTSNSTLSMNTPLGVFMVRCAVPRLLPLMVRSAEGASRTMRPPFGPHPSRRRCATPQGEGKVHHFGARGSIGVEAATPRMSSSTLAPASSWASARGAAITCRPTGSPDAVKPQGNDSAGQQASVIA